MIWPMARNGFTGDRPPLGTARDDSTGSSGAIRHAASSERGRPVIPGQRGRPGELDRRRRDVREDAVAERRPPTARPASRNGTGFSEWAVTGLPAASRIWSALPWSAVIASSDPGAVGIAGDRRPSSAATIRPRQRVDRLDRRAPRPPRRPCGRPCRRWRSSRRSGRRRRVAIASTRASVDARRAHLRLEVVGRDLRARDEAAAPRPAAAPRGRR